jgi:hypothetical protein
MPKIKTKTSYRRVDDGKYTTEEYAKNHPTTTVKETDKVPVKKKSPSKKKEK